MSAEAVMAAAMNSNMSHMNNNMSHMSNNSANHTASNKNMVMMDGHLMPSNVSGVSMMMMQMTFYAGINVTVLFNEWKVTNISELLGTVVCWLVLGILYQALKRLRRHVLRKHKAARGLLVSSPRFTKLASPPSDVTTPDPAIVQSNTRLAEVKAHIVQSLLQLLQTTFSFLLMLVVMTYNVWLVLAVILGDFIGYFVFAGDCAQLSNDHCG